MLNSNEPQIANSIQALVTKCKPNDENSDIDILRSSLTEQIEGLLKQSQANESGDAEVDLEFIQNMIDKMEIFDPIDRPFWDDENNDMALKTMDLWRNIKRMPSLNGNMLSAPMTNKAAYNLNKLFESDFEKCQKASKMWIDAGKSRG